MVSEKDVRKRRVMRWMEENGAMKGTEVDYNKAIRVIDVAKALNMYPGDVRDALDELEGMDEINKETLYWL
jgi:hypothetical protein